MVTIAYWLSWLFVQNWFDWFDWFGHLDLNIYVWTKLWKIFIFCLHLFQFKRSVIKNKKNGCYLEWWRLFFIVCWRQEQSYFFLFNSWRWGKIILKWWWYIFMNQMNLFMIFVVLYKVIFDWKLARRKPSLKNLKLIFPRSAYIIHGQIPAMYHFS